MKTKHTYLVITPFFPSNNLFVGNYIFDQVNEIRKQTEFDIRIVKTVALFSSEKDYEFKGFKVSIFRTIDFPFFIFPGVFNKINQNRFLSFLDKKGIENIKYSHSHVSYPASYITDGLHCIKMVQHHGLDALQLLNGRNNFIKKIQRKFLIENTLKQLNKADLNIGVSRLVLDKLKEYHEYSPKGEYVLYNGVDTSKFYFKIMKKNEVFTIGCVANFWEIKDQVTLIKAVEQLENKGTRILLRLIGSGPTLESCKNYVLKNKLNNTIVFEEEIKHEKLNDWYNEIDLFVLPSYYEALGCVYLESWATNTPFISVENQGISEVIPKAYKEKSEIVKSDFLNLSQKIAYFKKNKTNFEFDSQYDIKNTMSHFLKQDLFND